MRSINDENYRIQLYEKKLSWPRGPWDAEPDKVQWQDAATGLPCLAVRNDHGAWCGYVGVVEGHPYFGESYDDCEVEVHGGLTFSDLCSPHRKEHGICHIVEEGENDRVWWLGFDCAHYSDYVPGYFVWSGLEKLFDLAMGGSKDGKRKYRTLDYVKGECARLALQLAAVVS